MPFLTAKKASFLAMEYLKGILKAQGKHIAWICTTAPTRFRQNTSIDLKQRDLLRALHKCLMSSPTHANQERSLDLSSGASLDLTLKEATNLFRSLLVHLGYAKVTIDVRLWNKHDIPLYFPSSGDCTRPVVHEKTLHTKQDNRKETTQYFSVEGSYWLTKSLEMGRMIG